MPIIKGNALSSTQKLKREVLAITHGFLAREKSFAKIHIQLNESGTGIDYILFLDKQLTGEQKFELRNLLCKFFEE